MVTLSLSPRTSSRPDLSGYRHFSGQFGFSEQLDVVTLEYFA